MSTQPLILEAGEHTIEGCPSHGNRETNNVRDRYRNRKAEGGSRREGKGREGKEED